MDPRRTRFGFYLFVVPPGEDKTHHLRAHSLPDVCQASRIHGDQTFIEPRSAKLIIHDWPKSLLSGHVTWPKDSEVWDLAEYCPVISNVIKNLEHRGVDKTLKTCGRKGLYLDKSSMDTDRRSRGNVTSIITDDSDLLLKLYLIF